MYKNTRFVVLPVEIYFLIIESNISVNIRERCNLVIFCVVFLRRCNFLANWKIGTLNKYCSVLSFDYFNGK